MSEQTDRALPLPATEQAGGASRITLSDGAELVRDDDGEWGLHRYGNRIRWLNSFERDFVDSALATSPAPEPARAELPQRKAAAMSDRFTPEYEAMVRATVNPLYVNQRGTESYERATLLGEIDDLRRQVENYRIHQHSCGPTCDVAGCVNARLMAEVIEACEGVEQMYPTDVFPAEGTSVDCGSARLVRLTVNNCIEAIRQLQRQEGEKEGNNG